MRAEIVGGEAQSNDQALVSKNLFIITKDGIGELRVESRQRLGFRIARLHDRDMERIIGVARPWEVISNGRFNQSSSIALQASSLAMLDMYGQVRSDCKEEQGRTGNGASDRVGASIT